MSFDHDALFRHTFAQPEHAASLLRGLLPAAVAAELDWPSLIPIPGTSVDEVLRPRHADLLFTASLRNQRVLLYVVLEHKSTDDPLTPFQIARYAVRAYDRFLLEHPGSTSLPPIVPIVVHHGPQPWRSARSLRDLVDLSSQPPAVQEALAPMQMDFRFVLEDLAAMSETELRDRTGTLLHRLTNLLLQFVRPATERDPTDFVHRWRDLLQALWSHPEGRAGIYAVFSYLASQLEAPKERFAAAGAMIHEEARTMGKSIADQFREEGLQAGIRLGKAEGKAEGNAEGRAELLLRLCRARFGAVPATAEERIRTAAAEQLDTWAERLLAAGSLDEALV